MYDLISIADTSQVAFFRTKEANTCTIVRIVKIRKVYKSGTFSISWVVSCQQMNIIKTRKTGEGVGVCEQVRECS